MKTLCAALLVGALLTSGPLFAKSGSGILDHLADLASAYQDAFTVVLLPDTQYYSLKDPDTYLHQTEWIAGFPDLGWLEWIHVEMGLTTPPKMVIHLGDITHENTDNEWKAASKAHDVLDRVHIPYTVVPGNHDYQGDYRDRNTSKFNEYFGPLHFTLQSWCNSWYGGHYPCTPEHGLLPHDNCKNDNNYAFFEEGHLKFMVVNLEFDPRPEVLCWANARIREHPIHRIIIVTHGYLGQGGELKADCGAERIWDEVARRHSNVFMVLCGHVGDSEYKPQDVNDKENRVRNTVHQILTDYQWEPDRDHPNGNGWLRTLTFIPRMDHGKIYVNTISVRGEDRFYYTTDKDGNKTYADSPAHCDHSYLLDYNMATAIPYEYLAGGEDCAYIVGGEACGSDFSFSGTMRVEVGKEFKMEANTRLIFRDGARLVVDGKLTADGTYSRPVRFVTDQESRVKISSGVSISGSGGVIRLP